MGVEIELKLLVKKSAIGKVRGHPLLKALGGGRPRTTQLYSLYFDTPEHDLMRRGMALRLRKLQSRWIQELKGGGQERAGLHERNEWEMPVRKGEPDFLALDQQGLGELVPDSLRPKIISVFRTEFRRTTWLLRFDNGDLVEVALDEGRIKAGRKSSPICEIELELKAGEPSRLFQIALELQKFVPLWIGSRSKAQRGYGLLCTANPEAARVGIASWPRGERPKQVFRRVLWQLLAAVQTNSDCVAVASDPECLHQLRVALRRFRSVLPLLARQTELPSGLGNELRWLMGELGPLRDWDVLLSETLPSVAKHFPDDAGFDKLRALATMHADQARKRLRRSLRSQRYVTMVLEISHWLTTEWRAKDGYEMALEGRQFDEVAASLLEKRYRQLAKEIRHLNRKSAPERHRARILAKKLRYRSEILAGLFKTPKTGRFIDALTILQDRLGFLNDQAVTERLLERLADQSDESELARTIGEIIGWNRGMTESWLAELNDGAEEFLRCRPFWRE